MKDLGYCEQEEVIIFLELFLLFFEFNDISKSWSLHFRTNIKNYTNTIEKFLDWIKPYLYQGSGSHDFYAIVCYEGQHVPKIYYLYDDESE